MAKVRVTRLRIDRRTDKKKDRKTCYVCASVENRTAKDVTRAVTFYRFSGDDEEPTIVCTVTDIEVARLQTFPGGAEIHGSVEVCCQISCTRAADDRFVVALGPVPAADRPVDIFKAEDTAETPAPN